MLLRAVFSLDLWEGKVPSVRSGQWPYWGTHLEYGGGGTHLEYGGGGGGTHLEYGGQSLSSLSAAVHNRTLRSAGISYFMEAWI